MGDIFLQFMDVFRRVLARWLSSSMRLVWGCEGEDVIYGISILDLDLNAGEMSLPARLSLLELTRSPGWYDSG